MIVVFLICQYFFFYLLVLTITSFSRLNRFEKTNEMLINCNALLSIRYNGASKELKKHISFLIELKKDLETVFRRIRLVKLFSFMGGKLKFNFVGNQIHQIKFMLILL